MTAAALAAPVEVRALDEDDAVVASFTVEPGPVHALADCCEDCQQDDGPRPVVPGALLGVDDDGTVQVAVRCDQCELYAGDLEAAAAIVAALGTGRVAYEADPGWSTPGGHPGIVDDPWIEADPAAVLAALARLDAA